MADIQHCTRWGLAIMAASVLSRHDALKPRIDVAPACGGSAWTTPAEVFAQSNAPVVRFPYLVSAPEAFVVGVNISYFDSTRVGGDVLVMGRVPGKPLPPLAGGFTFAYPRAIADTRTRISLIWGESSEPRPIEAFDWPPFPIAGLWSSDRDAANRWSDARPIEGTEGLKWDTHTVGDVANQSGQHLGFVVPRRGRANLLLLERRDGRWRSTEVPTHSFASYAAGAVLGRERIIAYIAPARINGDKNSVFVVRSRDDGATWTTSERVSLSGPNGAYEPHLFVDSSRALYLVWRQELPGGRSAVRIVSSPDHGATWMPPQDLAMPEGARTLHADLDRCGVVHVLYEDWHGGGESGHLDHVTWSGRWSPIQHLFPSLRSNSPAIRALANGDVMIVFLAQPADSPLAAPIKTLFSLTHSSK